MIFQFSQVSHKMADSAFVDYQPTAVFISFHEQTTHILSALWLTF